MKYLLSMLFLTFALNVAAIDLPSEIKESVKEHCQGKLIKANLKQFNGHPAYVIHTQAGQDKFTYFFSKSGRLIHSKKLNNSIKSNRDSTKKDRFDKFEDEEKMTEDERRELEEEDDEDHDEDEDDEEETDDETYEELKASKLPRELLKKIKKHLGNKRFEVSREVIYIVESEEDGKHVTYIFSPKGTLIEKEVEEEEDDEEDHDEEED